MTVQSGVSYINDPRYREAAQLIQRGAWKAALGPLRDLAKEYPDQQDISSLIEEIRAREHLERGSIAARSPLTIYLLNRRRLTVLAITIVLALIIVSGWFVYNRWLEPARRIHARQAELIQMLSDAQIALAQARYKEAADLFAAALEIDPGNSSASQGLERAQRELSLATRYNRAVELSSKDPLEALLLFREIRQEDPAYKDVAERIEQIETQVALQEIFIEAEEAYQSSDWKGAIELYTALRGRDIDYRSVTVEQHLFESYRNYARTLLSQQSPSRAQLERTIEMYRLALSLQPRDRESRLQVELLGKHLEARSLMDEERFAEAAILLSAIHSVDPNFLNGDNRQALYFALLHYGSQLQKAGDLKGALKQYQTAANVPGVNTAEAKMRQRLVALALTPTPTPTPMPQPTPTPDPEESGQLIQPLEHFIGWIAYRSDRPGSPSGIWVMRPDGSEQQPVLDPNYFYEHLIKQAQWSNDNLRRVYVEGDRSNPAVVSIYIWRYDVPSHWREARVELLNNSALNYQPVFSPNNEFIVFTSQHARGPSWGRWGNWGDEIFLLRFSEINSDGYVEPHRLTFNDWEWDKHPTVSPDNQTIAFWSNRITGRAQIWTMNVDGSNQRNISNNEWNDWDPVFVMPRREIPNIEQKTAQVAPTFDPALYDENGNE
ncbi:MAG: hypothetical protein D6694_12250 [Gammaproteobacteria bacterium]|nr:MAG: hypothetical protein D6694_12250 [Gammaproteobacteria bacterium]